MTTGLVGCKKGVYDEKQALDAQQSLLEYKYAQETNLEKLRQSGASALEQLKYQFSINTLKFSDSLSDANSRKRDIVIVVKDIITSKVVSGATVSIPTLAGTVLTATTDSLGFAYFPASRNGNVPNPASAMVSKTGYASGTAYNTITGTSSVVSSGSSAGQTTMYLLSSAATNTIKGKVYIDTDLTNDAPEVAANKLITVYTDYAPGSQLSQRFEWSALTDADGNYTIKVPDISGTLFFAHSTFDTTMKMYINGEIPGLDSIPSVKAVASTYHLGANSNTIYSSGGYYNVSNLETPTGSNYSYPTTVDRYHVSIAADSNNKGQYIKSLSFSTTTLNSTTDSAYFNANTYTTSSILSGIYYKADGSTISAVTNRYLAGTSLADTVDVKLYDIYNNTDKYWITTPVLKAILTQTTDLFGNKYKYISKLYQKTGAVITNRNLPTNNTLYNKIKTLAVVNTSTFNNRTLSSSIASISNLFGGKTITQDLSFGAGKPKAMVR
jgi:hypothetical protein